MNRTGREVAVRAIICGTLGFRASLEVTEHQRTQELCSRLLPWLEQLGLGAHIEEFHREILETPHGGLPRDSQTEAFWRGETASLLGWAIQLLEKPHPTAFINPGLLVENLRILRPDASDVLSSARLRSEVEIDEYCTYCVALRHQSQLAAFPADLRETFAVVQKKRMAGLGLTEDLSRFPEIESEAANLASSTPGMKALCVVRALAAEWLLGEHE